MFIVYLNNASWEKGEAPKGKKCVSRHLSSFELLIRMVGENVSGQSIKKCHKIFFSSQLYMSRNVFEITLLCIIVCRGVNKAVCSRVLCLTGGCAHHVLMASAFHFLYSFGLCIIFWQFCDRTSRIYCLFCALRVFSRYDVLHFLFMQFCVLCL